ncbi:hypothetical protein IIA15_02475 [candidate division TA06 bacterium]|nr:hypothetical protein [candidate division TA06 bacterium]
MNPCARIGNSLDRMETYLGLCHRCRSILHLKKRFALTGRAFGMTSFLVFLSSWLLSFQGRFGIHTDWLRLSPLSRGDQRAIHLSCGRIVERNSG